MSISLIRLESIQLNPNSDQHLISPNNITACSNLKIMRMIEMITKEEMSMFEQILSIAKIRNIRRMVTRIYMLISGL